MPSLFSAVKPWVNQKLASVLAQVVPTNILARLSGFGEPYQQATSLSMAQIQSILRTAESGDTYLLFTVYRDMIINSAHIQTEMGKRIMSVIGQTENIQPCDKENKDDVVAAEAIRDMIANCDNWTAARMHLMGGHLWPLAVSEKIYEPVPASEQFKYKHPVRYRLKKLHPVNYALLSYRISYWNLAQGGNGTYPAGTTPPNYITSGQPPSSLPSDSPLVWNPDDWEPDLRFYSTLSNGQINFDLASSYKPDPARHVIHRGNVTSGFRDNYGGALRGVLFWWFLSTLGRDWFSRFMERYGSPFVVAYVNTQQKDVLDFLTRALSSSTKQGALMVDQRAKVELKETMVSGAADGYSKFIGLCHEEITKIILGQTLSTKPQGTGLGSGVADLQGEVLDAWRQYDERVLGETEQKQIFEDYLRINGFRGRAPKPTCGGLTKNNLLLLSKTLVNLKQAGLKPTESSLETLSEKCGFQVEIDELQNKVLEATIKATEDAAKQAKDDDDTSDKD